MADPRSSSRILTPERSVFEGDVEYVEVPGTEGYLGVLAHHAALVTALASGTLTLAASGRRGREALAIAGGFFEVSNNRGDRAGGLDRELSAPPGSHAARSTHQRHAGRRHVAREFLPGMPALPSGIAGCEQRRQVLLPQRRPRVRAVAVRLGAGRDQHEAPALHPLDLALGDAEFGRIDEVVGRVHLTRAAR